jgi:type I restriction enzyme, S subunit
MIPEILAKHFDLLADAPNGIPKLRELILQLAVQGKLVRQNPKDEPASKLIEEIQATKARFLKEGKIKRIETFPPVSLAEIPCELPPGWLFARLGTITNIVMGQSPPGSSYNRGGEGVPLINGPVEFTQGPFGKTVINQYTNEPTFFCESGDLLLCVRGSTTGRTNIAAFRSCIGRGVAAIQSLFEDKYVRLFVCGLRQSIIEMGRGSTFPSISRQQIENIVIPLPPLAEQRRIVAKVEELMALCNELEERQRQRKETRVRLCIASHAALTAAPDPRQFARHWQRICDHFHLIYDTPQTNPALRLTILNLAVRGRLLPQNANDEPAADLLENIHRQRAKVIKEGNLKKDKKLWVGLAKEPPHELPKNWKWTRLQDLYEISRGGSPRPAGDPQYFGGCIPWITVREITKDGAKFLTATDGGLTEEGAKRSRYIDPGDLLLTNSGATLGVPKISRIRGCMNDGVAVLRLFHSVPLNDFVYLYLLSQTEVFRQVNQGMGQPNLNTPIIAGWFCPLPPLSEQHRIVAKVDQLMVLCDELEKQLTQSEAESKKLMEAFAHHLLNGKTPASSNAA